MFKFTFGNAFIQNIFLKVKEYMQNIVSNAYCSNTHTIVLHRDWVLSFSNID